MNETFTNISKGILLVFLFLVATKLSAQEKENRNVVEYHLTIDEQNVNITGKEQTAMTINGGIPGPTLHFTEGDYAVIYVTNKMDVETSVHWHGVLVPNFMDGVPYLSTPPILPGTTFKYEFPIIQSGTYWYHSHTMLQEQRGVFGSIVIDDPEETREYDSELVLVLSDWTEQKPRNVLRNLKRGNEWYNIKKNTATPLFQVIKRGAFGAQLDFWRQRMEGADISDVYYDAFLINGKPEQNYPKFEPGEKVRLRIINAASSTYFWLTFGDEAPLLIAADGMDVVPIVHKKTIIANAETYDFIVTIPQTGKLEVRATAQDGSGKTSAYLGKGEIVAAPEVPKPDLIKMMKQMAAMDMKMGAPAIKFNPNDVDPKKMMQKWGMKMDEMKMKDEMQKNNSEKMGHKMVGHKMDMMNHDMKGDSIQKMEEGKMDMNQNMTKDSMEMQHGGMFAEFNYDYLKSPEKTDFDEDKPVKEVLLNLTGNMWRYIWSLNGVPLSKADKIKIEQGQIVRITLNNLTMMHHPMHLHGHFFRVLNENGEYSPLKHTVNVAPMQKITIEFDANEYGDWFFHCHILYHMMTGMARVYSYDPVQRDPRLSGFPLSELLNRDREFFTWGLADVASHMMEVNFVSSNLRNQFNLSAEYGWNENMEAEFSYGYYLNDWFRVFGGVNIENEIEDNLEELEVSAIAGIRYFTPYMFNLDVRIDHRLRPQISLSREILLFRRLAIFGEYEFQADFGWVNELSDGSNFEGETNWSAGAEYFLSRNFSIMASYDSRFGAGGGLSARF